MNKDKLLTLFMGKHWHNQYERYGQPDNPLTGGSHLCRFAKTHGDFAHHFFPDLTMAERQFILFREAYDNDKELKKRA